MRMRTEPVQPECRRAAEVALKFLCTLNSRSFADKCLVKSPVYKVVQMEKLIERFQYPTCVFFHFEEKNQHIEKNNEKQAISPCCLAALTSLVAPAQACSSLHGVAGALDVLQRKVTWGFRRCDYFCECIRNKRTIDCGAGMAVALTVLNSLTLTEAEGDFRFVPVQLICKINTTQKEAFSSEYASLVGSNGPEIPWVADDCEYHLVVGIVSTKTKSIKLWNFGEWLVPCTDTSQEEVILAVRVVTQGYSEEATALQTVDWMGLAMTLDQWMYMKDSESSSRGADTSSAAPFNSLKSLFDCTPGGDALTTQPHPSTVTVCISGCHMSTVPCSGVGVGRCIRAALKQSATIIAVHNDEGGFTGATDFCFDSSHSLYGTDYRATEVQGQSDEQHQYQVVDGMLTRLQRESPGCKVMFIPCTDSEVETMAQYHRCHGHEDGDCAPDDDAHYNKWTLLSPTLETLQSLAKPAISAAVTYFGMRVPPYILLGPGSFSGGDKDASSASASAKIAAFCNAHGYPILVKGRKQGAAVCSEWGAVNAAMHQKWARDGFVQRLVTGAGKSITFAAYQGTLLGCVQCAKTISDGHKKLWSGELTAASAAATDALRQFVKDTHYTGGGELEYIDDLAGDCWAIDWNPRFPSWVFAGTFAPGRNLPALLVEAAVRCANGQKAEALPFNQHHNQQQHQQQLPFDRLSFTKTMVELPRVNHHLQARNDVVSLHGLSGAWAKGLHRSHRGSVGGEASVRRDPLPLSDDDGNLQVMCKGVDVLLAAARRNNNNNAPLATPRMLLSQSAVVDSLLLHQCVVNECLQQALAADRPQTCRVDVHMCLSVKTQPHPSVLRLARDQRYLGECISLAEVRACLDSGYTPAEIVLTGPGKFWDSRPGELMLQGVGKATPLKAIFADSVADLARIVERVADPSDWLNCEVIGVRFAPAWFVKSRFGVDSTCPQTLLSVAKVIADLPPHIQIGAHFHHASSNLGATTWFDLARAFLYTTSAFSQLCGRDVAVVDFGGGWSADFLHQKSNQTQLTALLSEVVQAVPQLTKLQQTVSTSSPAGGRRVAVQFELGKCISERAGGVLARILEIREIPARDTPSSSAVSARGVVLDTTIGDLSAVNTFPHPVLWRDSSTQQWHVLQPGPDPLLGRSCMEFDAYGNGVSLPSAAQVGDFVLIAYTGAYDSSMQYDFGDGAGRDKTDVF